MHKFIIYCIAVIATIHIAIGARSLTALLNPFLCIDDILAAHEEELKYTQLMIKYPLDDTLFPPEIVPPTFCWEDKNAESDAWLIRIRFQDDKGSLNFLAQDTEWTPSDEQWEIIKRRSLEKEARVTILGVNRASAEKILSEASISISTSKDEVGAPLFYREVNLPFGEARKDPSHIRWRFGTVSSKEPRVVLKNIPTCANCHSFSIDGSTLAMEVDSANDKGSYAIVPIEEEMIIDKNKIITWSDYRKGDNEKTFGLLAQISPDGKNVVCTVKDLSFLTTQPGIEFSQLFFPIKGILVNYCR